MLCITVNFAGLSAAQVFDLGVNLGRDVAEMWTVGAVIGALWVEVTDSVGSHMSGLHGTEHGFDV